MKNKVRVFLVVSTLLLTNIECKSQDELILRSQVIKLNSTHSKSMSYILNSTKKKGFETSASSLHNLLKDMQKGNVDTSYILNKYLEKIDKGNYAVIFIDFRESAAIIPPPTIVLKKSDKWLYRNSKDINYTNYLKGGANVLIVEVYEINRYAELADTNNSTSGSVLQINNSTNLTNQTFRDLLTIIGSAGETKKDDALVLYIKEIKKNKIHAPSIISDSSCYVKQAKVKIPIHEKNFVTFQVGLMNTNYTPNNFSISSGNLVVTPDSAQKKNWKSNMFASIEFHFPRDVDNFKPIWSAFFGNPYKSYRPGNIFTWLYNITLDRIGVYGGIAIKSDPLSTIHAGFNYALSKEIYFNVGWTWINEVTPQVTKIGNITSLSDAEKYAKRKYSAPQFALGLSFSPSSVIKMLGIKTKG